MLDMGVENLDQNSVRKLAQKYNALGYSRELTELLALVYPSYKFNGFKKFRLHELINDVVLNNYTGEQVLKYYLFKHFYKQKVVAAFEINVNSSRADFLTINGCTKSFEIKSELDNLSKLKTQAADYIRAFEFNHIVIDEKHLDNAIDLVPSSFGIWSFKNAERRVYRVATTNHNLDAEFQLHLLCKKELAIHFKNEKGDIGTIIKNNSEIEINKRFKYALKIRYQKRWDFLLNYRESILPVDIQFFFKYNIDPKVIYQ